MLRSRRASLRRRTLRAVAELVCVVALFAFHATFAVENTYVRVDRAHRSTVSSYYKGGSFWNVAPAMQPQYGKEYADRDPQAV